MSNGTASTWKSVVTETAWLSAAPRIDQQQREDREVTRSIELAWRTNGVVERQGEAAWRLRLRAA